MYWEEYYSVATGKTINSVATVGGGLEAQKHTTADINCGEMVVMGCSHMI